MVESRAAVLGQCIAASSTTTLAPHLPRLAGSLRQKKRKKEETDSVDVLAKKYLKQYFDGPKPAGKKGSAAAKPAAAAAAAMKRWFD